MTAMAKMISECEPDERRRKVGMKKRGLIFAVMFFAMILLGIFTACDKKCSVHEFTFAEVAWNNDHTAASITLVCAVCGERITEEGDVELESMIEATCVKEGEKVYGATVNIGGNTLNKHTIKEVLPKTGHKYGAVQYKWSQDKSTCTAEKVCSVCKDTISEVARADSTIVRTSTCSLAGIREYRATFKRGEFKTQSIREDIPKEPHDFNGAIEYTWLDHVCTATRRCTQCSEKKKEAVVGEYSVLSEKTCQTDGQGKYVARFTDPDFREQTEFVVIPCGHTYDYENPEYEWNEEHTECIAVVSCVHGDAHTRETGLVTVDRRENTCTKDGLVTFVATFDCVDSVSFEVTLSAPGHHEYGEVEYVWSADNRTCKAQKTCSVCGEVLDETVNAQAEIVRVADCSVVGEKKFTATFTTEGFEVQIKTVEVKKIPHMTYDEYDWNDDHTSCTRTESCTVCHEVLEVTIAYRVDDEVTIEKTCETDGERRFTAKFHLENGSEDEATATEVIPKSHEYEPITYEYEWDENTLVCTAKKVCAECGDVVSETKTGTFSFVREEEGKIVIRYTVTFEREEFGIKAFDVEIEK